MEVSEESSKMTVMNQEEVDGFSGQKKVQPLISSSFWLPGKLVFRCLRFIKVEKMLETESIKFSNFNLHESL